MATPCAYQSGVTVTHRAENQAQLRAVRVE